MILYREGRLWFIAAKIQPWVLGGGIALLVMVAVRAVGVWLQAGQTPAASDEHDQDHETGHDHDHAHTHGESCDHEHDHAHTHGESCDHDHEHTHGAACDHDHDHDHAHGESCDHEHDHDHAHGNGHGHGEGDGHEHGWAPWRYVVLLLPIVLFFLGQPDQGKARADDRDNITGDVAIRAVNGQGGGQAFEVSFTELQRAPTNPTSRAFYEGKTIRVKGEYLPRNEKSFTLVRYVQNCCRAMRSR